MTVAGQHLQRFMAGNGADFHEVQVGVLEKPAGGFVPQVVKTEVGEAGFLQARTMFWAMAEGLGVGAPGRARTCNPQLRSL